MLIGPLLIFGEVPVQVFCPFFSQVDFFLLLVRYSPNLLNVKPKALPDMAQPTFLLISDYPLHHGSQLGATLHADVWQV